jgi:hypothetical protein
MDPKHQAPAVSARATSLRDATARFKLVHLSVPDPDAPGFRSAVRRTREFLAAHPDAEWDEFAREALDRAPGWTP